MRSCVEQVAFVGAEGEHAGLQLRRAEPDGVAAAVALP
eukprot:SAG11_NODE_15071_length_590_cov_0.843177_2_plen_37_part_01